jgi:hypothetical protein
MNGTCVMRLACAAAFAALVAVAPASSARGDEPAPADTTLGRYLDVMSDSTDARFGAVAAPAETTGLDSARVFALTHPERWGYRKRQWVSVYPVCDFNRVDGPVMGVGAATGTAKGLGKLSGEAADATGPNLTLGNVKYSKIVTRDQTRWRLDLFTGRATAGMDREDQAHDLSALTAFISGGDRSHYLRQDGFTAKLSRERITHRLAVTYRDELELPRATTATWNLRRRVPAVVGNLPAARGRASELGYELLWKLPRTPVIAQVIHQTSSRAIGSDFEYRRTRASAGADVGIGHTFAVVPQVEYGALSGEFTPQAAFYLGGPHTLRSLDYAVTGGSRLALARLELIMVRDVFEVMHLPHSAAFPIQLGAFAATGSAWGRDPYTGITRPGSDWPRHSDWRNEAGFSVMYQPGIPDPAMFVRFNWAYPIGPGAGGSKLTLSIGRGLDLVGKFERE